MPCIMQRYDGRPVTAGYGVGAGITVESRCRSSNLRPCGEHRGGRWCDREAIPLQRARRRDAQRAGGRPESSTASPITVTVTSVSPPSTLTGGAPAAIGAAAARNIGRGGA